MVKTSNTRTYCIQSRCGLSHFRCEPYNYNKLTSTHTYTRNHYDSTAQLSTAYTYTNSKVSDTCMDTHMHTYTHAPHYSTPPLPSLPSLPSLPLLSPPLLSPPISSPPLPSPSLPLPETELQHRSLLTSPPGMMQHRPAQSVGEHPKTSRWLQTQPPVVEVGALEQGVGSPGGQAWREGKGRGGDGRGRGGDGRDGRGGDGRGGEVGDWVEF